MEKFADVFDLSEKVRRQYVVPHGFRKFFLRLEGLNYEYPIDEYYSSEALTPSSLDNRMAYWAAKTVNDMARLAPDSRGYMSGFEADRTLASVAKQYGMHPLMVPCWTCLVGKVVNDFGEACANEFLRDGNPTAEAALARHLKKYGKCSPPSLTVLMTDSGMNKIKKVKLVNVLRRPAGPT